MRSYALIALVAAVLVGTCGGDGPGQSNFNTSTSAIQSREINQETQFDHVTTKSEESLKKIAEYLKTHGKGRCQLYRELESDYLAAATAGDAVSHWQLAGLYESGDACIADSRRSAYWMEQSALKGIVDAIRETGLNFLRGRGVLGDSKKAYAYLSVYVAIASFNPYISAVTEYPLEEARARLSQDELGEAKRIANNIYDALPANLIQYA